MGEENPSPSAAPKPYSNTIDRDTRGVNTIVRNEIGTPVRRKQLGDYFKAPGRDYRASYPDIRNL
jgi:hypothetical protein